MVSEVSKDWTGWCGDLATGVRSTFETADGSTDYQYYADTTIGSVSSLCNYSDFCTDSDAIKIAELLNNSSISLSAAIEDYYTHWVDCRYSYLYARISRTYFGSQEVSMENFITLLKIYLKEPIANIGGLSDLMGVAKDNNECIEATCAAFAKYIYYYF